MCKMRIDFELLSVEILGMTDNQVGIYTRLLTAQAVLGRILPETFGAVCGSDRLVAEKFIRREDGYYHAGKVFITAEPEEAKRVTTTASKAVKAKYGEYVLLKAEEYQALCDRFGKAATDRMIEVLDNYKGSSGKKYKEDYRAILSWVAEKVRKENPGLFVRAEVYDPAVNPFD